MKLTNLEAHSIANIHKGKKEEMWDAGVGNWTP
jgi:hypothetical protein